MVPEQLPERVFYPQRAALRLIGSALLALGVFLSGFVISEPAPYELMLSVQIALFFLAGLKISRAVGPLLILLLLFNVGGMLSLMVMADLSGAPMYMAVSLFLALTAVFYAAMIEDDHRRLGLIFRAWVAAAVITALLGILGYFHAFPGADVFTLYDRAKGAFQDPNVFGPYLVAPALYLMYRLLTGGLAAAPLTLAGLLVLTLGIFLSFSRAAWGLYLFSALALIAVMLLKERTAAFRLKIFTLALAALLLAMLSVGLALQSKKVSDLFLNRAKLVQDYDGARLGRFERHKMGFLMAMERPLGLGPMVLGKMFGEDEHNIWLKSLTTYGWLGFVSYLLLVWSTLVIGFRALLRDRPWQPYLMIAWIVLAGHTMIGNVIDLDHWRHVYMLFGLIWGCFALEQAHGRKASAAHPA
ncbi:O-antigen ligase family protein [Rhizobium sp. SGZ-381]|uniref:O-antigen ligase family protein n=1 Tax=Rhizobium sp. SGZ-381 TaxID=3342800 RepID=UPI00366AE1F3